MHTSLSTLTVAAAAVFVLTGAPLDGHDGDGPVVMIVLDDTKLLGVEEGRHAAAGFDAVHRTLLVSGVRVAAITSGPGSLAIDVTDAPNVLPPIAEALRTGAYTFGGTTDPAKASAALDATVADTLGSLARLGGTRHVLVVVGRSATVSPERRARLEANAALARRGNVKVVWLDLERDGCAASPPRDSTTLGEAAACGVLGDQATLARALDVARRFLAQPATSVGLLGWRPRDVVRHRPAPIPPGCQRRARSGPLALFGADESAVRRDAVRQALRAPIASRDELAAERGGQPLTEVGRPCVRARPGPGGAWLAG